MTYSLALQMPVGYEHLGYGTFAQNLAIGMKPKIDDLFINATMETYEVIPEGYETCLRASPPGYTQGKWKGQNMVLFSMWESTVLPPTFSSMIHNYDQVLVPNDLNVELFSRWNPNVSKVPLGYNSDTWYYTPRTAPDQEFRFLMCGAGFAEKTRKGGDLVLEAFERAFPNWEKMTPRPKLVVKCLKAPWTKTDFMETYTGIMPVQDLVKLYQSCHCMVLASRGEGWGYHPQQAVASGMPAILSEIPGHTEYSWLPGFVNVPTKLVKALKFLYGDSGEWWEPDLDSLTEAMLAVYNNYEEYYKEARIGSEQIKKQYDHNAMVRNTLDAIGMENLNRIDTGEWIRFLEMEYLTVTNRPLGRGECDIGGTPYEFHSGVEYWVPANVRQVLVDAGYVANESQVIGRVPSAD